MTLLSLCCSLINYLCDVTLLGYKLSRVEPPPGARRIGRRPELDKGSLLLLLLLAVIFVLVLNTERFGAYGASILTPVTL